MTPYTTLQAERAHQAIARQRKAERESYKIAEALASIGDVQPHAIRIACPLPNHESLIDFSNEPVGENSIGYARYARQMRDWRRRNETTRINPKTHPIEWAWSNGRPALGFKPECIPVEFEYLTEQEQLDYLKSTSKDTPYLYLDNRTKSQVKGVTTFVENETLDTRLSDPIPDYIRAREVGFDLTSIELAFKHDDDDEDSDAEPGATKIGDDGYCKPDAITYTDHLGWAPPTPYMRSWVDWERRRKYSGDVIRAYCYKDRTDQLDIQVEGIPRMDGNSTAEMRTKFRMKVATLLAEGGFDPGSKHFGVPWQEYLDWVEWNRDEATSIGMTRAQEELYYQAPALEAEQDRWTWVDREYQEVYEALEELSDQQARDGEQPRLLLHLRTHKNRATAEASMRPDVQNSPSILGLHTEINWLRDEDEDDLTFSERVNNWFVGVEKALLEGLEKRIAQRQ